MKQLDTRDSWDKHWEDFSDATVFNPAQDYRRRLILSQLGKIYRPGNKLLDIGSGQGDLSAELVSHFPDATIYGVDLSQKGVEISCQKVPSAHFFKLDLLESKEKIPTALESGVDVAICSEVLEHLDEPSLFLQNVARLLKKNAVLVVTVPSGPRSAFDRHVGHRQHFSMNNLKELLRNAGFDVSYIFRAGFPFFNLYKLLIILRGKRLIVDTKQPKLSIFARFAMSCFNILFRTNLTSSPWGWQLVAVAKMR